MSEMDPDNQQKPHLPSWLKRPIGSGQTFETVRRLLDDLKLATVCNSAGCPNQGECFSRGTATFMILGDVCTRNCQFCKVRHGRVEPPQPDEPERVAEAVVRLDLRHVVVTSVSRDDLPDGGADHFARTIEAIRRRRPAAVVEVLTPDFLGRRDFLDMVC
ncbi:MAG: lipoyl synthase, partial [Sedimentisphaerales bacterium]|nr:lipoyl synthase [Sedimentisphaerales bacterium]